MEGKYRELLSRREMAEGFRSWSEYRNLLLYKFNQLKSRVHQLGKWVRSDPFQRSYGVVNSSFQDGYSQSFAPPPPPTNYSVARGPEVGLKLGSKKVWCDERDLPAQLQGAGRGIGRLGGWAGEVGGGGPAPLPLSTRLEVGPAAGRCSRSSARTGAPPGPAPGLGPPPAG